MNRILLTGATGYIGSFLTRHLKKNKINLKILSRKPVKGFKTYVWDYENKKIPKSFLENIDTVVHLAAFSKDLGRFNDRRQKKYFEFNHYKTLELADLSINSKIKKFIFLSSSKAIKYKNIDNINLVTNYGSLKRFTENEKEL